VPATRARTKRPPAGDPVALLERDVAGLRARYALAQRQLSEHATLLRQLMDGIDERNALLKHYLDIHDALADLHGEKYCRCETCLATRPTITAVYGFLGSNPPAAQESPSPPA
jgi:hypothetical protein